MFDVHPALLESLNRAVAHILAARGGKPTPQEIEQLVDHLFSGLVQGADREGADWSMTWAHLVHEFWGEGASLYEAQQLAFGHFTEIVIEICEGVSQGCWDKEVDSVEKLETFIRFSVERMLEADLVMGEA